MILSFEGLPELPATVHEDGNGMTVDCYPDLEDPTVVERQHRAVCITKPYAACAICRHATFTLTFRANKEQRLAQVMCPRWKSEAKRLNGEGPEAYAPTEISTCESRPFPFCSSCPSAETLREKFSTDKTVTGWFGRWERIHKEEFEDG